MRLLAPLWLAVPGQCRIAPGRRRWWAALVCAGVLALTVSPWLVRSFLLTGSVTLSTQTGFFLWLGNNPYTFSRYPQESIDRSQAVALAALSSQEKSELKARQHNEALVDEWFWKKGLDYIRESSVANPRQWSSKNCGRVRVVTQSAPQFLAESGSRVIVRSCDEFVVCGGCGPAGRHWREHSIFYAQFVAFAAVTAVFFGHTSYRAYLDVYWIVFAAAAGGLGGGGRPWNPLSRAPLLCRRIALAVRGGFRTAMVPLRSDTADWSPFVNSNGLLAANQQFRAFCRQAKWPCRVI